MRGEGGVILLLSSRESNTTHEHIHGSDPSIRLDVHFSLYSLPGSYILLKAFQQLCAPPGMKVTSGWQPSLSLGDVCERLTTH